MFLIAIDRASGTPAYQQIRDRIVELTDEGVLRPGDHLPATRVLAETSGVHRTTVVRAYEELRALGYVESRPGSHTRIRRRRADRSLKQGRRPNRHGRIDGSAGRRPTRQCRIDWSAVEAIGLHALHDHPAMDLVKAPVPANVLDLDRLGADPTLAPNRDLRRCVRSALADLGGTVLDYSDATGWRPLRDALATRLALHGIRGSREEILITSGAQHALDLLLRYLTRPGDRVVLEAPTYGMAHALLRLHRVEPIEVPLRDDGMDLDRLEQVLTGTRAGPKLVYTMPSFQNPTGITTDPPHRERLLALCEEHRTPLVEDAFEEEMKYTGRAALPIKSMDEQGIVLYVGTFSKVVFPGLRLGWIAGPAEAIERLTDIQHASVIAGNTLAQAAVARFLAGGGFESYLRRVHRVYRKRMRALLIGLDRHMPDSARWTRPAGGYTAWLTLPEIGVTEDELVRKAAEAGVKVGPGRRYYRHPPSQAHLRLSVACIGEESIEEACRRLGAVVANSMG